MVSLQCIKCRDLILTRFRRLRHDWPDVLWLGRVIRHSHWTSFGQIRGWASHARLSGHFKCKAARDSSRARMRGRRAGRGRARLRVAKASRRVGSPEAIYTRSVAGRTGHSEASSAYHYVSPRRGFIGDVTAFFFIRRLFCSQGILDTIQASRFHGNRPFQSAE